MILNSKQLEELESIHDTVAEFEEDGATNATVENDNFDEGAESALAWRRGMIERAAANVKKAARKHIDPQTNYPTGALVFDRVAKRFGRVNNSVIGVLKLVYLTGGDAAIRQSQIDVAFTGDDSDGDGESPSRRERVKEKIAAQTTKAALPKTKLKSKKDETEIRDMVAVDSLMASEDKSAAKQKKAAKAAAEKPEKKKPTLKAVTKSKPQTKTAAAKPEKKKVAEKPKPKPAMRKAVLAKPKKSTAKSKKPLKRSAAFASYLPAGVTTDPVADPNGYIRQNFKFMSNKELATVTGLSEHTIRRKLGEWGLKRSGKLK